MTIDEAPRDIRAKAGVLAAVAAWRCPWCPPVGKRKDAHIVRAMGTAPAR